MTRAHTAAVLAQLGTALDEVFEGVVIDRPELYCTVFTNTGIADTNDRMSALASRRTIRYTVHSVGKTPDQAQWVADRVADCLVNFKPVVAGWRCDRLRHESSQTTLIDRDVPGNTVYYAVDEFDLYTSPGGQ